MANDLSDFRKIAFVVNNPDFLISHRLEICLTALKSGFECHIICEDKPSTSILRNLGFVVHPVDFNRGTNNILKEFSTFFKLFKVLKSEKFDLVHAITIKPYLYVGIIARLIGITGMVSSIAGLGILFSSSDIKYRFVRILVYPLFLFAFGHKNQTVIFQNTNDRDVLKKLGVVNDAKCVLIHGSGVDLDEYAYIPPPTGTPVVSLASRLLRDKGIEVYAQAVSQLKKKGVVARFLLIGSRDDGNNNSVTQEELIQWSSNGTLELLGHRSDIANLFSSSNIIVLPSFYGEGLPKVLVEAAASGRAVITTDHPGCRDAIEPGVTGELVPVRDPDALANAIERMLGDPILTEKMGKAGRELAESSFDVKKVVDQHMQVYNGLLHSAASSTEIDLDD